MNPVLIAAGFPDPDVFAAILVPLGIFSVPVIAILTRHQRQMTEIIHGRRNEDALRAELEGVRAEVSELRSQLRALNQGPQAGAVSEDLKHRLG